MMGPLFFSSYAASHLKKKIILIYQLPETWNSIVPETDSHEQRK